MDLLTSWALVQRAGKRASGVLPEACPSPPVPHLMFRGKTEGPGLPLHVGSSEKHLCPDCRLWYAPSPEGTAAAGAPPCGCTRSVKPAPRGHRPGWAVQPYPARIGSGAHCPALTLSLTLTVTLCASQGTHTDMHIHTEGGTHTHTHRERERERPAYTHTHTG